MEEDKSPNSQANEVKEPLMNDHIEKKGKDHDVEASVAKDGEDLKVVVVEPSKFIGLTKEELAKYEFDPFWRRLRMFLFVLFWIAWITMFAAAIAIVVLSPKCPEKPKRYWWQKKVCQQIYTRSFRDSNGDGIGDLAGITEQISQLKKINIQTIWPTAFFKDTDLSGYSPSSLHDIDPSVGTLDDFKSLIKTSHDNGIHVIVDLIPSVTSIEHPWFKEASTGSPSDPKLGRYFFSEENKEGDSWRKLPDGSKFYRHWRNHPERPILNLQNAEVKSSLKTTINHWLDLKVDGFYVFSSYLAMKDGANEEDYDKFSEVFKLIHDVVEAKENETGGSIDDIMLFTSEADEVTKMRDDRREQLKLSWLNAGLNYIISSKLKDIDDQCDAKCVHRKLNEQLVYHDKYNETWPIWELGNSHISRVATRVKSKERAELLSMLLLTLPGSIINYYGDEVGLENIDAANVASIKDVAAPPGIQPFKQSRHSARTPMHWNGGANAGFSSSSNPWVPVQKGYENNNFETLYGKTTSSVRLFKRLAGLRDTDDTFVYGTYSLKNLNDSSDVLTLTKDGREYKFIAALNLATKPVESIVDLVAVAGVSEATVVAMTSNLAARVEYEVRHKVDLQNFKLSTNEGILLKYKL